MVDTVENAGVRLHRIATDPPKKEFPLSKSGAKPPAKPGLIARLLGAPTPKPPPPRRYAGPAKDASRDVWAQLAAPIKAVRSAERRVGKAWVSRCRYSVQPDCYKHTQSHK